MQKKEEKDGHKGGKNSLKSSDASSLLAGIVSLACSLGKEALMQTYTDSSELVKEGHGKVMCVSYCELVKTKPHRIPGGIVSRLLYLKLHW